MKRNEMIAVIVGGGSVLHEGKLITSVENLPSHAELAHTEEEKAAAADDLDKRIADLLQQRAKLPGGSASVTSSKPEAKASNTKSAKNEKAKSSEEKPNPEDKKSAENDVNSFPEGFPTRQKAVFEGHKITFAEVARMDREALMNVNGIAGALADEVLSFIADQNKK